jgi:chromosome segregation ATPase
MNAKPPGRTGQIPLTFVSSKDYIYKNGYKDRMLDNDLIVKQFEEIERKVESLIEICRQLEATNSELNHKVAQLEKELQSKVEEEKRYQAEKDLIRSKVDSLLARLEDISDSSSEWLPADESGKGKAE